MATSHLCLGSVACFPRRRQRMEIVRPWSATVVPRKLVTAGRFYSLAREQPRFGR